MNKLPQSLRFAFLFIASSLVSPHLFGQVPKISFFAPLSAPVGVNVIINGNNFSTTPTDNIVRFGAVRAKVISSTNTTITVTVPKSATFVPLSVTVRGLTVLASLSFITTFPGCDNPFSASSFKQIDIACNSGNIQTQVELADLDNDSKPDVLMKTLILRNTSSNGAINFDSVYYSFGARGDRFVVSDINADGMLDIVIGDDTLVDIKWNIYAPVLRVYINTSNGPGDIAFTKLSFLNIPNAISNLHVHDVDSDGKPDIVIPGGLHSSATYFLRNTSIAANNVSFAPVINIATPDATVLSIIGDIDGDGKQDMLMNGPGQDSFSVYRNTSSGTGHISFASGVSYHSPGAGKLYICDFNNDGNNDIVFLSQGRKVEIFRNTGVPGLISFIPAFGVQFSPGALISSLQITDLDGDGKPDLVAGVQDSDNNLNDFNNISVFKNSGVNDSISFMPNKNYSKSLYSLNLALGDLDGDGKPDISATTLNSPQGFSVFHNGVCSGINLCSPAASTTVTTNIMGTSYRWQVNRGTGFRDINNDSNYSSVYSSILLVKNIPYSWYGYQYRCVTDDMAGGKFTLRFKNVWTGAIDSSWENPANWSCGAVPNENTDVILNNGTVVLNTSTSVRSMELNSTVNLRVNSPFALTIKH